jgi:SAM-dependent methyltransferase
MKPAERFSDRVEYYARFRPGYPARLLSALRSRGVLPEGGVTVADVGAGTGIFSKLLLDVGCTVLAIEPNAAMRAEAERALRAHPNFKCLDASAESTGLPAQSVRAVFAAQAFHWFDIPRARAEFVRILRPGGHAVLVWNDRRVDSTPFLRDYEALLRHFGTDYEKVGHRQGAEDKLSAFFAPNKYETISFDNRQVFDHPGLEGRLLSSSYVPTPGHKNYAPMLDELRRVFDRHQFNGTVAFDYDTRAHFGTL